MEARKKLTISCTALALAMAANGLLFLLCFFSLKDSTRATFYGLNALTILLLFATLAIQSYGYDPKKQAKRRGTPYLYALIGMLIASTVIISLAAGFSRAPSIHDFIAFLLCLVSLAIYIYIIVQRDHA